MTQAIVLDRDRAPPPQKGGRAPQFSAHVYCGQTAGWINMPLGMELGLDPGHTVVDGDPVPPKLQKGEHSPSIFDPCLLWPNVWIKNQDAIWWEVGLGPGHTVLDGDPAAPSPTKGHSLPTFRPCLMWPNGWMDQDANWYEGRPQPGNIALDADPAPPPPPKKGGTAIQFLAYVYCGQMVTHLSYC